MEQKLRSVEDKLPLELEKQNSQKKKTYLLRNNLLDPILCIFLLVKYRGLSRKESTLLLIL